MKPALTTPPRTEAATQDTEVAINLGDLGEKVMSLEVWTQSWASEPQKNKFFPMLDCLFDLLL